MCCSDSTDWYESILICQSLEVEAVLTFQPHCGCLPKMEPEFLQYVIHAIQSAHTLARWRNPSRCGLTTKPLAPHLEGADSPTPTTQTAHSTERKRESATQRKINRQREEREGGKTAPRAQSNTQTLKKSIIYPTEFSVDCVQHNLLDSHGSGSNILFHMHRPPVQDLLTDEHQPKLGLWMTTFLSTFILSSQCSALFLYPLLCGPDQQHWVDPFAPRNLSCLFVTDSDLCCQSKHGQPNRALYCFVYLEPLCMEHPHREQVDFLGLHAYMRAFFINKQDELSGPH